MSIFDTPPPIINKDNLLYWLEKNYDFFKDNILNSYKLNSERDYNLMILTKNNNKFVIKISNSSENYKILQLQDNLLKFLSKSIVSKNIPKIIHKHINIFKDENNRECYIRILSFLEGEMFAEKQNNDILCNNLGRFLGNLSVSLKKFSDSEAHRNFIWDSSNVDWIENEISLFSDKKKKGIIKMVLESYKNNFKKRTGNMRYSIIHGDANNYNIVVNNNNIVGLLDYGDVIYAPTVCELTVALAYSLMNTNQLIERCCNMIKAYQSVYTLNKDEVESISTLICTRLLITVTMASKQQKKYPDNKYLIISENDAWNLLFKISDISLKKLTREIVNKVL